MKGFKTILCAVLTIMCCTAALAVLPPSHYRDAAQTSQIKAIAVVQAVSVIDENKRYTSKRVTFRLARSFAGERVPASFRGTCVSVDHSWQEPGVGGELYYYPVKGQRVFVTVSRDGGTITSYTPLTPGLERAMTENPGGIRYGMGKATVVQDDAREKIAEHWYRYLIDGTPSGYLHITGNRLTDRYDELLFRHEFLVKTGEGVRRVIIETRCRDDNRLTPEAMTIRWGDAARTTVRVVFEERPADEVSEGIFRGLPDRETQTMPLPEGTITDLLLFEVVKKLSFESQTISYHLLESAELNLKKDRTLEYRGRDGTMKGHHRFTETTRGQASYWLNDNRDLVRVRWDRDKDFVLSDKEGAQAMTGE